MAKKDPFKLKSDVNLQNDDNHNKHNEDKLINIVECLTGESKHVFSKLTEETIISNIIDWCNEKCHFARRCALKTMSTLKVEHNIKKKIYIKI